MKYEDLAACGDSVRKPINNSVDNPIDLTFTGYTLKASAELARGVRRLFAVLGLSCVNGLGCDLYMRPEVFEALKIGVDLSAYVSFLSSRHDGTLRYMGAKVFLDSSFRLENSDCSLGDYPGETRDHTSIFAVLPGVGIARLAGLRIDPIEEVKMRYDDLPLANLPSAHNVVIKGEPGAQMVAFDFEGYPRIYMPADLAKKIVESQQSDDLKNKALKTLDRLMSGEHEDAIALEAAKEVLARSVK